MFSKDSPEIHFALAQILFPVVKGHAEMIGHQKRLLNAYIDIKADIRGQGLTRRIQNARLARIEAKLDRLLDDPGRQPNPEQEFKPRRHQPWRRFPPAGTSSSVARKLVEAGRRFPALNIRNTGVVFRA